MNLLATSARFWLLPTYKPQWDSKVLLAVAYLHSHQIVHRDLKLENFLYESEVGPNGFITVRCIES